MRIQAVNHYLVLEDNREQLGISIFKSFTYIGYGINRHINSQRVVPKTLSIAK